MGGRGRGSSAVLKQHEIQAKQQRVLVVGGMLCVADNLPGVAYVGFMQGSWNSLLTLSSSVFQAQREKQKAVFSLKELFRAGMISNFSKERVCMCCTSPSLPALGSGTHGLLQLKLGKRNPSEEGDFFPKTDSLLASRCQLLKQILSISHSIFKK